MTNLNQSCIALPEAAYGNIMRARAALNALAHLHNSAVDIARSKNAGLFVPAEDMASLLLCITESIPLGQDQFVRKVADTAAEEANHG